MEVFLRSTEIIDWHHPDVRALGESLASGASGPIEVARRCFEWVRDELNLGGSASRCGRSPAITRLSRVPVGRPSGHCSMDAK